MDYEQIGRDLVSYMRAFIDASEALDRAEEERTATLRATGVRLVDVNHGDPGQAIVTDHDAGQVIAVVPEELVLGTDPNLPWPSEWASYDTAVDPRHDPSGNIGAAQDALWALDDNPPFPWLSTWQPLEEVDEMRALLRAAPPA